MRWEYFTLKIEPTFWLNAVDGAALDEKLNALGRNGWELVSSFSTSASAGRTYELFLLFKRPLTS